MAGLEALIVDALGGGNIVQWSAQSAANKTTDAILANPDVVLRALGAEVDGSRWTCSTHTELTDDPFYCSKHGALEDCVPSSCGYFVMVERPKESTT